MSQTLTLHANGALGSNVGPGAIGCIAGGELVLEALDFAYLKTLANDILCIQDDGGLYTDDTTDIQDAGTNDVPIVGATLVAGDAIYFGHATAQPASLKIIINTAGVYTTTTFTWKYWNGTAWTLLAGISDGTSSFQAAAATVSVTWTAPTDWVKNTVDNQLAYWVQAECDATGGTTTQATLTQAWAIMTAANAVYSANDATTVPVMQANLHGTVGDQFIIGHESQKFCKVKIVIGTSGSYSATLVWKYWDGDSWAAITTFEDKTVAFDAAAGTEVLSFVPPTDWTITTAANGPAGQVGYFIALEITAFTSITTAPVMTSAQLATLNNSSIIGHRVSQSGAFSKVDMMTRDHAGTANDSVFMLVNGTQGTHSGAITWTKTTTSDQDAAVLSVTLDDEVVLVQIVEDGTTEIGATTQGADFYFRLNP